jgi:hypothetical protein
VSALSSAAWTVELHFIEDRPPSGAQPAISELQPPVRFGTFRKAKEMPRVALFYRKSSTKRHRRAELTSLHHLFQDGVSPLPDIPQNDQENEERQNHERRDHVNREHGQ